MEALIGGITALGVAVAVVTLWRRIQEEVDALQIKGLSFFEKHIYPTRQT